MISKSLHFKKSIKREGRGGTRLFHYFAVYRNQVLSFKKVMIVYLYNDSIYTMQCRTVELSAGENKR